MKYTTLGAPFYGAVQEDNTDVVRIAEILGWKFLGAGSGYEIPRSLSPDPGFIYYPKNGTWEMPNGSQCSLPAFTSDPTADYQVLEWVRENTIREKHADELWSIWHIRAGNTGYLPSLYLPGDYSRALLALKDKGLV